MMCTFSARVSIYTLCTAFPLITVLFPLCNGMFPPRYWYCSPWVLHCSYRCWHGFPWELFWYSWAIQCLGDALLPRVIMLLSLVLCRFCRWLIYTTGSWHCSPPAYQWVSSIHLLITVYIQIGSSTVLWVHREIRSFLYRNVLNVVDDIYESNLFW